MLLPRGDREGPGKGPFLEGLPQDPRSPARTEGPRTGRHFFAAAGMRIPARPLPGGAGEKVCTPPGPPPAHFGTPQNGSSGWGARFPPPGGGQKKPPEL